MLKKLHRKQFEKEMEQFRNEKGMKINRKNIYNQLFAES